MLKIKNDKILCNDNFINALLQLELSSDQKSSIISQSLVRKFSVHNFDEIGYSTPQLFEHGTLIEISLLLDQSVQNLLMFDYPQSKNLQKLTWLLSHQKFLSPFTKINLAYCLITLCRYIQAKNILKSIDYQILPDDFKFYYLAADFFISNRFENGERSEDIFSMKQHLIETLTIDPLLILQSCAQAIVWHLKSKEISSSVFDFFIAQGQKIVDRGGDYSNNHSLSIISGWYRALAMVPAFNKDLKTTREYMLLAKTHAESITPKNEADDLAKRHMLKTYYESESKEFLYFHGDYKLAEQSALNMIKEDPYWSLSWAELGELYCHEKLYDKALDAFTKSYELGAPRKIRSYFHMGNCQALLGNSKEALSIFKEILSVDPNNVSAALAGFKYSNQNNNTSKEFFASFLNDYVKRGFISNDKINQMVAA